MKRGLKIIAFILTCIIISCALDFVLTPSSYLRVVLHEVRDTDKNYDLVFVGESMGESNIDPYVLDKHLDYNTYNLCRRIVKIPDIPYLLKEANKKGQIKVCVFHVDQAYFFDTDPNYYSDAYIYPHLSDLRDKTQYFFRYVLNADYRVLFMRYTVEGTGDLKLSKTRVANKLSNEYKEFSMEAVTDTDVDHVYVGRGYRKGIAYSDDESTGTPWSRDRIRDDAVEGVLELADYCREQGIKLIAVQDPLPHERRTSEELADMKDYFGGLFSNAGVDYIDFNYISDEYLTWDESGFTDAYGHMMGSMADEYCEVLGEVLQKKLDGEDISGYFEAYPNMR